MPKIYSQAHSVLIWLGEDMSGMEGVKESILQAIPLLSTEGLDPGTIQEASTGVLDCVSIDQSNGEKTWADHDWTSINRFLTCAWFHRKWIIQETAFSGVATVFCGNITFPWKDLSTPALRMYQTGVVSMLGGIIQLSARKALHNISILFLCQEYRSIVTLLDAVQSTVNFQCGDSRDHIFALCSMARDGSMIQLGLYTCSRRGVH